MRDHVTGAAVRAGKGHAELQVPPLGHLARVVGRPRGPLEGQADLPVVPVPFPDILGHVVKIGMQQTVVIQVFEGQDHPLQIGRAGDDVVLARVVVEAHRVVGTGAGDVHPERLGHLAHEVGEAVAHQPRRSAVERTRHRLQRGLELIVVHDARISGEAAFTEQVAPQDRRLADPRIAAEAREVVQVAVRLGQRGLGARVTLQHGLELGQIAGGQAVVVGLHQPLAVGGEIEVPRREQVGHVTRRNQQIPLLPEYVVVVVDEIYVDVESVLEVFEERIVLVRDVLVRVIVHPEPVEGGRPLHGAFLRRRSERRERDQRESCDRDQPLERIVHEILPPARWIGRESHAYGRSSTFAMCPRQLPSNGRYPSLITRPEPEVRTFTRAGDPR